MKPAVCPDWDSTSQARLLASAADRFVPFATSIKRLVRERSGVTAIGITSMIKFRFSPLLTTSRKYYMLALIMAVSLFNSAAYGQVNSTNCGQLRGGGQYGPYDYRTDKSKLGVVEQYHFSSAVEASIRGVAGGSPGGDIDYTLRAFPNHHRALISVVKYGEKTKLQRPAGLTYDVECYFERAIRFQSDDLIVRMLYASFLAGRGRTEEGIRQLDLATQQAGDNPFTHYNLGLVYFDLKEYGKATRQAHRASALGFTQNALKEQLVNAGKWSGAVEATESSTPGK